MRYLNLEIARGLAAIYVVAFHAERLAGRVFIQDWHLFEGGHAGVDFFFVLSGFIISVSFENKLKIQGGGGGGKILFIDALD